MPRKGKIGPISKDIRDLCRERAREHDGHWVKDDVQFKQGLVDVIRSYEVVPRLLQDIGMALAKWGPNYLYLLTNKVDPEIGRWAYQEKSDWAIVMKWVRGELKGDKEIKSMLVNCLQSPLNKTVFERELREWIRKNEGKPDSKKYLRDELVGALLDFLFALADEVNLGVQEKFKKWASKMSE